MSKKYELRFTGSGGQGVILASVLIAEAAILAGMNAIQSQAYGPEARGGTSKAEAIISEGKSYLSIIVWTFLLFIISQILMSALRAVGTVNISFYISIVSLVLNVGINYVLIFGKFGFPQMGIVGAAIGCILLLLVNPIYALIFLIFTIAALAWEMSTSALSASAG